VRFGEPIYPRDLLSKSNSLNESSRPHEIYFAITEHLKEIIGRMIIEMRAGDN
jgi:hypothetical protein